MNEPLRPDPIVVLNRLLRILVRSLPAYLEYARPWTSRAAEKPAAALLQIAADRRQFAGRVTEAIHEHRGRPSPGQFPAEFTSRHDLAVESVAIWVAESLGQEITLIEGCIGDLATAPLYRTLAEEILANAKSHQQVLASVE